MSIDGRSERGDWREARASVNRKTAATGGAAGDTVAVGILPKVRQIRGSFA